MAVDSHTPAPEAHLAASWRVVAELRPSFWDGGAAHWISLALTRADGAEVATFHEEAPGPARLAAWGQLVAPDAHAHAHAHAHARELELPGGCRLRRVAAHLHCVFPAQSGLSVASVPLSACEAAFAVLRASLADLDVRAAADREEATLRAIHHELRRWSRGMPHIATYWLEGSIPELQVRVERCWAAPLPANVWCAAADRALPIIAA